MIFFNFPTASIKANQIAISLLVVLKISLVVYGLVRVVLPINHLYAKFRLRRLVNNQRVLPPNNAHHPAQLAGLIMALQISVLL